MNPQLLEMIQMLHNPVFMVIYMFCVIICLALVFSDKELTRQRGLLVNTMWLVLAIVPYVNIILALLFFALALSGFFMTKAVSGALDRTQVKKEVIE